MYKLTEEHVHPAAQCVMKVSVAAQVMSHTVAAEINAVVSQSKEQCLHSFCFHTK
jgi:hypothetical protein